MATTKAITKLSNINQDFYQKTSKDLTLEKENLQNNEEIDKNINSTYLLPQMFNNTIFKLNSLQNKQRYDNIDRNILKVNFF